MDDADVLELRFKIQGYTKKLDEIVKKNPWLTAPEKKASPGGRVKQVAARAQGLPVGKPKATGKASPQDDASDDSDDGGGYFWDDKRFCKSCLQVLDTGNAFHLDLCKPEFNRQPDPNLVVGAQCKFHLGNERCVGTIVRTQTFFQVDARNGGTYHLISQEAHKIKAWTKKTPAASFNAPAAKKARVQGPEKEVAEEEKQEDAPAPADSPEEDKPN
jgi:hypothetical protein